MPDRSLILAIETSNPSAAPQAAGVALAALRAGALEPIASQWLTSTAGHHRGGHDDDLMPAIARLFAKAKLTTANLARVAVSVGPGGYTGLRVACAGGAMIAEAAGCPCAAVPTALVVLESVPTDIRAQGPIAIGLASKDETTWVQLFQGDTELAPPSLISAANIDHLINAGVRTFVVDHFLPLALRAEVDRRGIAILPPIFDPAACARAAVRLPPIDPAHLVPIYPREPDAVRLWKDRKSSPA